MHKITIKNLESIITNEAQFQTQQELNEWLQYHISIKTFRFEDEFIPEVLDINGQIVQESYVIVKTHEYAIEDISEQTIEDQARQADRELGFLIRQKCESALDVVTGFNARRDLSFEQVDEMQLQFEDIEKALQSRRIDKATYLLMAVEPDGILVTEEMIQRVLAELQF